MINDRINKEIQISKEFIYFIKDNSGYNCKCYLSSIDCDLDLDDYSEENTLKVIAFTFNHMLANTEINDIFFLIFSDYFRKLLYKVFENQIELKTKIVSKKENKWSAGTFAIFSDNIEVYQGNMNRSYYFYVQLPTNILTTHFRLHSPDFVGFVTKPAEYKRYYQSSNFHIWKLKNQ